MADLGRWLNGDYRIPGPQDRLAEAPDRNDRDDRDNDDDDAGRI
jgi:endogenous inhibitor of DNA gyrase (YacG/DUF329 family)